MKRILIHGFALSILALLAPVAQADPPDPSQIIYADTGHDPDDVPVDHTSCCQQDPDIRATTRRVFRGDHGRRWLSITIRGYEYFIGYWHVVVHLDSRRGPREDARMAIADTGVGPVFCRIHIIGESPHGGRFLQPELGGPVTCRVRLAWADPDKRIRWYLTSRGGGEGTGPVVHERAPDRGWYP